MEENVPCQLDFGTINVVVEILVVAVGINVIGLYFQQIVLMEFQVHNGYLLRKRVIMQLLYLVSSLLYSSQLRFQTNAEKYVRRDVGLVLEVM